MTSEFPTRLQARIDGASEQITYWWRHNAENTFDSSEPYSYERIAAERTIKKTFEELYVDRTFKLQIAVGENALRLLHFRPLTEDYFIMPYIYAEGQLQPGETLDILDVRPLQSSDDHGLLRPHYFGDNTSYLNTIGLGRALTQGGSLTVVPQGVTATHKQEAIVR